MTQKPGVSLVASPGRRQSVIEAAVEAERRGFAGMYGPSFGDGIALCQSVLERTTTLVAGSAIEPIYLRTPQSLARTAAYLHELGGGRFRLGIGVSHAPTHARYGLRAGKPLEDMRAYVGALREMVPEVGPLPPIVLATLRNKMLDLAVEIADGAVWANGARSFMAQQVARVPEARRKAGFSLINMIPTVIDEDRAAAAAVNRATLTRYVQLPNYRNYWRLAGHGVEMDAIEAALKANDLDRLPRLMSDAWLSDVTLYGPPSMVRDGIEAWFAAGVLPVLVPLGVRGGQLKGLEAVFDLYA